MTKKVTVKTAEMQKAENVAFGQGLFGGTLVAAGLALGVFLIIDDGDEPLQVEMVTENDFTSTELRFRLDDAINSRSSEIAELIVEAAGLAEADAITIDASGEHESNIFTYPTDATNSFIGANGCVYYDTGVIECSNGKGGTTIWHQE